MPQVVALGDINVDVIAHIPRYPSPGGDGLAERISVHGGGSAANTAIVLARLGLDVGLIGRMGEDPLAEWALEELREAGVDLSAIQRDPEAMTGLMFIAVTHDGERTMFGYRGANARTDPDLLDEAYITGARLLHLSGYALLEAPQREAALRALEVARGAGSIISLDVGLEAATKLAGEIKSLSSRLDLVFSTLIEARRLTGCGDKWSRLRGEISPTRQRVLSAPKHWRDHLSEDAEGAVGQLLGWGVGAVALKLGAQGCLVGTRDEVFAVPAFAVKVKDTTGAGDAFDAGFIFGRLKGLGWRESALLANALGALAAAVEGAGGSLPGREDARAFLRERLGDPSWQAWQRELCRLLDFLK